MNFVSKYFRILLAVCLLLVVLSSDAKSKIKIFDGRRHKVGMQIGYGFQNGLKVDYRYRVCFFQPQYSYAVFIFKNWSFELLFQPQANLVRLKRFENDTTYLNSWEVGLNGGILVRKNILQNRLGFYLCISSGPHYISQGLSRQVKGFIFSDNFFAGVNVKLYKQLYFDGRFGFRHSSNAGINNLFGSLGLFVTLGKAKTDKQSP